ncbi:MAG: DUF3995 domain-containing protein [Bacteroidota bacterium]
MLQIAQIINTILFLVISGLHFYWAFGSMFGKKIKGATSVLPEVNGKSAFIPSTFSTFVVAFGLLLFAEVSSFGLVKYFDFQMFSPIIPFGNLAISIIFMMRAMGDFRLVGFFKKIKSTQFAENDSKFYSPLCVLISVLAFVIYWNLK